MQRKTRQCLVVVKHVVDLVAMLVDHALVESFDDCFDAVAPLGLPCVVDVGQHQRCLQFAEGRPELRERLQHVGQLTETYDVACRSQRMEVKSERFSDATNNVHSREIWQTVLKVHCSGVALDPLSVDCCECCRCVCETVASLLAPLLGAVGVVFFQFEFDESLQRREHVGNRADILKCGKCLLPVLASGIRIPIYVTETALLDGCPPIVQWCFDP